MLKYHVFEENHNFITVLHQNKLVFNSFCEYLWSTYGKNDLKYLNISFFYHLKPISSKNLRFEAWVLKRDQFFVWHPHSSKIYIKDETPKFSSSNFYTIWKAEKNGNFLILGNSIFIFQIGPFCSEKMTFFTTKMINYLFKSLAFKSTSFWPKSEPLTWTQSYL